MAMSHQIKPSALSEKVTARIMKEVGDEDIAPFLWVPGVGRKCEESAFCSSAFC